MWCCLLILYVALVHKTLACLFTQKWWFVWSFQHENEEWLALRIRHLTNISAPFSWVFPKEVPSLSWYLFHRKTCSYRGESWRQCVTIEGQGNSVNFRWTSLILSPHILGSRPYSFGISPWQTALAECSRLGSSLFAFVPCVLGQPSLAVGFRYCWMGSHSCPSAWARPLPCVKARDEEATHMSSTWCTRGKSLSLLLMANSLAFHSREHPVQVGKGQEQSCFKHLISSAVPKTFDHFPSEGSNS